MQVANAYANGEGMKHYVNMVQESDFAAREKGYTFVPHQQEVGAGYFDDVTTVIQGGSSSVKALTGSNEEELMIRLRSNPLEYPLGHAMHVV